MALAFQIAKTLIVPGRSLFGSAGLYVTGALVGLTDVDALTMSAISLRQLIAIAVRMRV